jgi:hypothetical protein
MNFVSILPHRHSFPKDGFGREGNNLLISIPRVETQGYQYVAPMELIFIVRSLNQFHLPQSLVLWARWAVVAAGQRLASAAEALPRLVQTAVRDWSFWVKAKRTKKKKIKPVSILPHWHPFPKDGFGREGNYLVIYLPWVAPMAIKDLIPSGSFSLCPWR